MLELEDQLHAAYKYLAKSDSAGAQALRRLYRGVKAFSLPAPKPVVRPVLWGYLAARGALDFGKRVFVAQPLFAAYCKQHGKNLRTGEFIHYVQGKGDIIVGDNVWLDGKCTIIFASTLSERPTLLIGDNTAIGHDTMLAIGKRITIGKDCNISGATAIFDSNGHPSDPVARRNHVAPRSDEVRPVTIGDDVWIGKGCSIFPGVRIGDAAIISACSVVRRHVPPYTVVAGNPAQIIYRLPRPTNPGANGAAAMTEPTR